MQNLCDLLRVLGISKADVARRAGVTPAAVTIAIKRGRGAGYYKAVEMVRESHREAERVRDMLNAHFSLE